MLVLSTSMFGCSVQQIQTPTKFRFDTFTLRDSDDLEIVADAFGVPSGVLETLNPNVKFIPGDEIKIPLYSELFPVKRAGPLPTGEFSELARRYTGKVMWPALGGIVSSPYGERNGKFHSGVDIAVPKGSPVFAAQTGQVVYAGDEMSGYGDMIGINSGTAITTLYAHNSRLFVKPGDFVHQGDLIALAGATGHATGPHVHFEIRAKGSNGTVTLDPLFFFSSFIQTTRK